MESYYLIVGLGNPGAEYEGTRHNAGFALADRMARRWQGRWRSAARFDADLASVRPGGRRCLLCKPRTFMNASGTAVAGVARYYKAPLDRVLVLVDDADLALGEIRMRPAGSAGGHHGLESVERHLGSRGYPRLRMGIGRRSENSREITDYVLGRFTDEELALWAKVLERAAEQVECWLREGASMAMNRFNGVVVTPATKEV